MKTGILTKYHADVQRALERALRVKLPPTLSDPVRYAVLGGGKRLRPLLALASANAISGNYRSAIHVAVALELLHGFTLVHDDIMDDALLRRNKPSVYKKWGVSSAILSGDALYAMAYKELLKTKSDRIKEIVNTFTDTVIKVCIGQALDIEEKKTMPLEDYISLIEYKSMSLILSSVVLGAMVADAEKTQLKVLTRFGRSIGTAFQLQDDLLDVVGDKKLFGKMKGGDIYCGKKTILPLLAMKRAKGKDKMLLQKVYHTKKATKKEVENVISIFWATNAIDEVREETKRYLKQAEVSLRKVENSEELTAILDVVGSRSF